MSNAVVIKGTTYGFSVYIDEQADFTTISEQIKEKFDAAGISIPFNQLDVMIKNK